MERGEGGVGLRRDDKARDAGGRRQHARMRKGARAAMVSLTWATWLQADGARTAAAEHVGQWYSDMYD